MRRTAAMVGAAVLGGLLVGWVTAPNPAAPPEAERVERSYAPAHGGVAAAAAGQRFAELGFGAPIVPEVVEAAPPPPDIAVIFRRDLTAIERRNGGALVWVVDLNQMTGRRALHVGDVYRDGWRVTAASEQLIELRKRREVRRISVFDLPQENVP